MGNQKRDGMNCPAFLFRKGRIRGDLSIYKISDKYISFLHSRDKRVQFNKTQTRPYVGIVLFVGECKYFVPMESPKPSHAKIKAGPHIYKINGGALGLLGFNNMIPVPDEAIIEFDIDSESDEKYKRLLQHQAVAVNRSRADILGKASKTYYEVVNKKNAFLCKISCNFKELEKASKRYNPNHRKKQ